MDLDKSNILKEPFLSEKPLEGEREERGQMLRNTLLFAPIV